MTVSSPTSLVQGSSDDLVRTMRLAVAWQHPQTRLIQPVGLLTYEDQGHGELYSFCYLQNAKVVPDFRPFLSFPALNRIYRSARLFPLFAQRVMDERRPDFARYVSSLDLSPEATPWEQIARSEGRRAGDTIMVFPEPAIDPDGATRSKFFVHGIRHTGDPDTELALRDVHRPMMLGLDPDPMNPVNPRAMCVTSGSVRLGWVPDLLLDYIHEVMAGSDAEVTVQHVNGPGAPPHLRLLVRFSGYVEPSYRPFSGPMWEPFA